MNEYISLYGAYAYKLSLFNSIGGDGFYLRPAFFDHFYFLVDRSPQIKADPTALR